MNPGRAGAFSVLMRFLNAKALWLIVSEA